MILFGIVDGVFKISGRGVVLSFDFSESLGPGQNLRVGDKIELRTAGETKLQTEVRGIEHLKPIVRRKPVNIGVLLPSEVGLERLEKGMEIWRLRDG